MTGDERVSAGAAALAAGRWEEARSAFEAALAASEDPRAVDGLGEALWWLGEPRRSMALRQQAYVEFRRRGESESATAAALGVAITQASNFGDLVAGNGWVSRAEGLAGGSEPARSWVVMTRAYVCVDPREAVRLYRQALAVARRHDDVDLELCCLAGLGEKLVLCGQVAEGMGLVDECMAAVFAGEPTRLDTFAYASCDMLSACDLAVDLSRARRWCVTADRFVAEYGCPFLFARCRMVYGSLLISDGQWEVGEAELTTAGEMSRGAGPAVAAEAAARLADLRLRQGRFEDVEAVLRDHTGQPCTLAVQAALALEQDEPTAALRLLERLRRRDVSAGSGACVVTEVRAYLALGAVAEAQQVIEESPPPAHPVREAFWAKAQAHLRVATSDPEAARFAHEAADRFADLEMPYEEAQVKILVARAETASRPGRAVLEAEEAWRELSALGARADADEAAALLRSLGVRPPVEARTGSGSALTRREVQVLDLVRAGLTNPEIAARLHISRKTTAHHVSGVLTKLGLRNRAEAAAWRAERDR